MGKNYMGVLMEQNTRLTLELDLLRRKYFYIHDMFFNIPDMSYDNLLYLVRHLSKALDRIDLFTRMENVLARIPVDALAIVFRHLGGSTKDLNSCYMTCKTFKRAIDKYHNQLYQPSREFTDILGSNNSLSLRSLFSSTNVDHLSQVSFAIAPEYKVLKSWVSTVKARLPKLLTFTRQTLPWTFMGQPWETLENVFVSDYIPFESFSVSLIGQASLNLTRLIDLELTGGLADPFLIELVFKPKGSKGFVVRVDLKKYKFT